MIVLEAMVLVSAEHRAGSVSEGLRAERRHHVAEVAVCEAERRRGAAEVRLRGSGGFCGGLIGLGGLPVVQVCAGRRFWRFWGSLVRRENGERL